jgi:hypothetical protein
MREDAAHIVRSRSGPKDAEPRRKIHLRVQYAAMKLQFTTRTLLLATAAVAISLGGALGWIQALKLRDFAFQADLWIVVRNTAFGLPLWLPVVFLGYSVGHRRLTVAMVVVFAIAELMSIGVTYGLWNWAMTWI